MANNEYSNNYTTESEYSKKNEVIKSYIEGLKKYNVELWKKIDQTDESKNNILLKLLENSQHKHEIKVNEKIIELLKVFQEGYQNIVSANDLIKELKNTSEQSVKKINPDLYDVYYNKLKEGLKVGKKMLEFKARIYLLRKSDDINFLIERTFLGTPPRYKENHLKTLEPSELIEIINKEISNCLSELKTAKSYKDYSQNNNTGIETEHKVEGKKKHPITDIKNKNLVKIKEQISQIEEYKYINHEIVSNLYSVFDILEKINNNEIYHEPETIFLLRNKVSETLYLMRVSEDNRLLSKSDWLVGVYNKAYKELSKKYEQTTKKDQDEKLQNFMKQHNFEFNIEDYSADKMLEKTNISIMEYMLNNKEKYQREEDLAGNKKTSQVIFENIAYMSDENVRTLYAKMVDEFRNEGTIDYYPEKLQKNFTLATFYSKKSRGEIEHDTEYTPQIRNSLIKEYKLFDKYIGPQYYGESFSNQHGRSR